MNKKKYKYSTTFNTCSVFAFGKVMSTNIPLLEWLTNIN